MTIALIALSDAGARRLAPLVIHIPEARLYVHESVRKQAIPLAPEGIGSETAPGGSPGRSSGPDSPSRRSAALRPGRSESAPSGADGRGATRAAFGPFDGERFKKIADLTKALFPVCRGLVYAAPAGVVVRAVAPLLKSKFADPAVIVIDAAGRWAISLLSGHEGGANALAVRVANIIGAEPIVTTTTEALKSVIVGIGCRRGTKADRIVAAVRSALDDAGVALDEVRLIASADIKADEAGLIEAAEALDIPIRFIPAEEIRASSREFSHSDYVKKKVNLPAVAEPAALLAGRRTQFICRKKTYNGITIALAREGFS